jgi:hypothetical protein
MTVLATTAWKAIAFALAVLVLAVGSYAVFFWLFRNDPAEGEDAPPEEPK